LEDQPSINLFNPFNLSNLFNLFNLFHSLTSVDAVCSKVCGQHVSPDLTVAASASDEHVSARGSPAVLWALAMVAAAHVVYLGLLLTCDVLRISPLGFVAQFAANAMVIAEVDAHSAAARAGLRAGDHVVAANGQAVDGRLDWARVRVNIDPAVPLALDVTRDGQVASRVVIPLATESYQSLPSARPGLLTFRLAQVITLGFAILVAVKRSAHAPALLGAWLLASIATVSIVLPMRMAVFWRELVAPLELLLWLPATTSAAVGPLLFAFFATFPTRTWSPRRLGLSLVPGVLAVAWSLYTMYVVTRPPGPATGLPDLTVWVFAVNVVYAVSGIGILIAHRRAAQTSTDRRRIDVLGLGAIVGVTAGTGAVAGYSLSSGADFFATPALTLLALAFLAVPASFAYAILRHRLFDVGLIVRQGVRYALARRLLTALIPVLGALLLADVLLHRNDPILTSVQSRWWWYTAIGAALFVARSRRERWLKALDRRFFRERYDAQRLLRAIAQQVRQAPSFDVIAPLVVRQVDEALHPEFVDVFAQTSGEPVFTPLTRGTPERVVTPLPSSLAVIGLLSVLRQPLSLSLGDTAWVRHQLPPTERALLGERRIELLVPIVRRESGRSQPVALLVLGPRRSEEPYNEEDLDLLGSIARELGLLLERPPVGPPPGLAECQTCGRCFDGTAVVCSHDSQRLTSVRGSRVLNGRYRLDRRVGQGGMGAVYAATDEALERQVAVKLIRDDLAGSVDLDARFRREARAVAGFTHPNVVRVYDFGLDRDSRAFLVMELLQGETLRQRLEKGTPLDGAQVLHILRGVCAAVSAAHRQGLVHRDLKPENIFLERQETGVLPKVLDFGLAKAFGVEVSLRRSSGSTAGGLLVGTLEYMAPEQAAGDVVTPAWDIWALGVIAHEMLTGRHPFRRSIALTAGAAVDEPALPDVGRTPFPDAVALLMGRALSSQQSGRPKDALEFLQGLERVLA
jgi:membrane-associated protease RseP (regulator of RpoE activity)